MFARRIRDVMPHVRSQRGTRVASINPSSISKTEKRSGSGSGSMQIYLVRVSSLIAPNGIISRGSSE